MPSYAPSLKSTYIKYTDPCISPTIKTLTLRYVVLSVIYYYHTTYINSYVSIRNTPIDSCVLHKCFLFQKSSSYLY